MREVVMRKVGASSRTGPDGFPQPATPTAKKPASKIPAHRRGDEFDRMRFTRSVLGSGLALRRRLAFRRLAFRDRSGNLAGPGRRLYHSIEYRDLCHGAGICIQGRDPARDPIHAGVFLGGRFRAASVGL